MYIASLRIKNFRKYGTSLDDQGNEDYGLSLNLNRGLNVLVGENDSGKTAIIDSLKLLLGTQSNDWVRLEEEDFHVDRHGNRSNTLSIECVLAGLSSQASASFLEWLSFDENGEYILRLGLRAKISDSAGLYNRVVYDVRAGADDEGIVLTSEVREKLRATYLKPLRDAHQELIPRRGSRLSQILASHEVFKKDNKHELESIMEAANTNVADYFENGDGKSILDSINGNYLKEFGLANNKLMSGISVSNTDLRKILEKLELNIFNHNGHTQHDNLGLGSNNLLFIATELLLLRSAADYDGLKLALIEEIEAHLHPQSQINLVSFIEQNISELGFQAIITTHSPALASKVKIENLVLCKNGAAFPLGPSYTKLSSGDYEFLRRFLDDTKANLFFANSVILVEGPSENLLLPSLANYIGKPLHKYGVSIVNVNSTALLRYANVFKRQDGKSTGIPVACVTDRDIPPALAKSEGLVKPNRKTEDDFTPDRVSEIIAEKESKFSGPDILTAVSKNWTLEYELALSVLRNELYLAIQLASKTKNLEEPLTREYEEEVKASLTTKLTGDWISKGREEVAIEICAPVMKKKVSKAVVAQLFSVLLDKRCKAESSVQEVKTDQFLDYLVKAITHVTSSPASAPVSSARNRVTTTAPSV
ncbi:AAA family ATPase [uncultured Pontibacter sp.]|uniref:ATP-dependent nuclease n=1 Tax=uncultured Pontibacter sp. TaxID=453356 RepID=UPI002604ECA2|nr:AAA family ATPase [uncultured Pontibacter sp.]